MAKVQISIDDALLDRIDSYADECYISRSGLISMAMSQYLNTQEVMVMVRNLGKAVQRVAETGVCDDETLAEMEQFSKLCSIMTKQ